MKKQKRALVAAVAGISAIAIGATIAYNQDSMFFNNNFTLSDSEIEYTELFTSPENWQPCQPVEKKFTVTNKSAEPVAVRFKLNEYWRKNNSTYPATNHVDTDMPITWNDNGTTKRMVVITPDQAGANDWTYDSTDGWYYLNRNLAAGATTSSYLSQVMLDCDLNLVGDVTYTEVVEDGNVVGMAGATQENDYSNAKYHIFITAQTISADGIDTWTGD